LVAGYVVAGQVTGRSRKLECPVGHCSIHGKVTKHDPEDLDVTSLRQWLLRVPASVIDAGLAAAVAVAVAVATGVSTRPGVRSVDVLAYLLGLMIAALVLVRRRWPVAVLVASAAILHLYYLLDYPGILPAVPLSVALAGPGPPATSAGRCWWPAGSSSGRSCSGPWPSRNR
jgi:membrane-associated PAP2 superfamily phosphatase